MVSTADVAHYVTPVEIWGPQDSLPTERATRVTPDRVKREMGPTLLGLLSHPHMTGHRLRQSLQKESRELSSMRASPPMAPTVQTAKRGTVWPFGRLEHWWLGSAPKLGCDGAVTTHK